MGDVWVVQGLQPGTRVALLFAQVTGLIEQGEDDPGFTRISTEREEYVTSVPFDEALRSWTEWLEKDREEPEQ